MRKRMRKRLACLVVLMILPAASALAQSRVVLGSVETHGLVRINGIIAPAQATLFGNDRIETNNGQAVVRYNNGTKIRLGVESIANFGPIRVQLERGLMGLEVIATGTKFAASTLRLEPAMPHTAANVTLLDHKASVAVIKGILNVNNLSGERLVQLNAGEARLFEETAPSSDAVPAEPAISSSKHRRRIGIPLGKRLFFGFTLGD